jgi:hypothetical protein
MTLQERGFEIVPSAFARPSPYCVRLLGLVILPSPTCFGCENCDRENLWHLKDALYPSGLGILPCGLWIDRAPRAVSTTIWIDPPSEYRWRTSCDSIGIPPTRLWTHENRSRGVLTFFSLPSRPIASRFAQPDPYEKRICCGTSSCQRCPRRVLQA